MGEHKYNPTAQLAKEGKIEPRPKRLSKTEEKKRIRRLIMENSIFGNLPLERSYNHE